MARRLDRPPAKKMRKAIRSRAAWPRKSAAAANRKRWRRAETPVYPAPAKTPVGGAVRDAGKEESWSHSAAKAAEGNPASTAALRRVAISLNQRRALRHPAGAPKKAMSFAVSLKKRIREEVMKRDI